MTFVMRLMGLCLVLLLVVCRADGHEGWGIVVHERFGVVFADIPGNTIWRAAGGRPLPLLRGVHSHGLTLGADGAIYGTDSDAFRVWRFDGRFTFLFAAPQLGLQSFLRTRDGSICSANRYDHRRPIVMLLCRRPDGEVVQASAMRFQTIDGMTEGRDGTIVLADGARLRAVHRNGSVSTLTPPLTKPRWGEDLLGLSTMRDGTVYIADHAGRRILRWRNGEVEEVERSGFWWSPAGVEHHRGELYVLEHLRPPLSLLGDLQVGPYLRVRRGAATLAVVWGRRTPWAVAALLAVVAAAALVIRKKL